jgi:hypothetical protein
VHEGIADLLGELKDPKADGLAESEYRKAADAESQPIDRIRLALKLANYYSSHGDSARAQTELENMRDLYPDDATRFGIPSPLVPTSVPPPGAAQDQSLPLPRLSRPTPAPLPPPEIKK